MRKIKIFPALITAAIIALGSITVPTTGFAEVNIQINGYLPAPEGVRVYEGGGRPYYFHDHRRVYLEKDRRHHDNRGHGKKYKDHGDYGHDNGHDNGRGR